MVVVFAVFLVVACLNMGTSDYSASVVLVFNDFGHGSGAIVGPNAVLTAKHVAMEPDLRIRTASGDEYPVFGVALDPDSDLAVLYIEGEFGIASLVIDREPLEVGDNTVLIGTPLDPALMNCVLQGRVVRTDYEVEVEGNLLINIDVIDAHGTFGCSGGPLLDADGEIRGVMSVVVGPFSGCTPVGELDEALR
jgi:S1-C subfamily serine protease